MVNAIWKQRNCLWRFIGTSETFDNTALFIFWNSAKSSLYAIAAEQKARTTYDNILRLADDDDVRQPIKFLRQREVVHFQRFGEALETVKDRLDGRNYYAYNPAFDRKIK